MRLGGGTDNINGLSLSMPIQKVGNWTKDKFNLPAFRLNYQKAPEMYHQLGNRRIKLIVNQNNEVRILSCDYGPVILNQKASKDISTGAYCFINTEEAHWSTRMDKTPSKVKEILYGLGYASFTTYYKNIRCRNLYFLPYNNEPIFFHLITLRNETSHNKVVNLTEYLNINFDPGNLYLNRISTEFKCPTLIAKLNNPRRSNLFISCLSNDVKEFASQFESTRNETLFIKKRISDNKVFTNFITGNEQRAFLAEEINLKLEPKCEKQILFLIAYTDKEEEMSSILIRYKNVNPEKLFKNSINFWINFYNKFSREKDWVKRELIFNIHNSLAGVVYDAALKNNLLVQGGMYLCFPTDQKKFGAITFRDTYQMVMAISYFQPEIAKDTLRLCMKLQKQNGDLPRGYDLKGNTVESNDSDTELWFSLALSEYITTSKDYKFLDEIVSYKDGLKEIVYEHCKKAILYTINKIGYGEHGLLKFQEGDWNDYLNRVGKFGRGESVMNSALAVYSWSRFLQIAKGKKDSKFTHFLETEIEKNRKAVNNSFDKEWFIRGYTDKGEPVGSFASDRLFLNAQSFAVLGECSSKEKLANALKKAYQKCMTPIGPTLMSKPYSYPASEEITCCLYHTGEGENAGVWHIAGDFFALALFKVGFKKEAFEVWKRCTLYNHFKQYPHIWYGIWCSPDEFCSHFSKRYGFTQKWREENPNELAGAAIRVWSYLKLRQKETI